MKILVVTAEPECAPLNGVGKFVWEFARELKKNADVRIFSLQMDPFVISPEQLLTTETAYKADYSFKSEYDWYTESLEARHMFASHRAIPFVKSVLAEFAPDIIYLQGPKVWFPFRYEKNVVIAFHGLVKDIVGTAIPDLIWIAQERWEVEAASRVQALILFSSFMESRWKTAYANPCHPRVLPLGIDASSYRCKKNPKKFTVAFFGRLDDTHKRYTAFLEGVRGLPSLTGDGRAVSFHVWGQGEKIDETKYPEVTFHGHVTDDELVTAFAETDVVVMPSAYEPFGYVALEALASGCILLATTGQGMDDFIEPGKNCVGITSESSSVHTELFKVMENPEKYLALAEEGIRTASRWSWDRSVREHITYFEELVRDPDSQEK